MMRWFFYSALAVISLAAFSNNAFANLGVQCPYGYKNDQEFSISASQAEVNGGFDTICSNLGNYVCAEPSSFQQYIGGGQFRTMLYADRVLKPNCAIAPEDDSKESGCYPDEILPNNQGGATCNANDMKTCYGPSGQYQIIESKNCSDYCVGDNPATQILEQITRCENVPDGSFELSDSEDTDTPDDNCGLGFTLINNICVADDGTDLPDPDDSEDPTDPTDPNNPDQSGSCDSFISCLAEAEQANNCDSNRDSYNFAYSEGSNYSYSCQTCNGPNADIYNECNSCALGYDPARQECYSSTCPYGNCSDPENNTEPLPNGQPGVIPGTELSQENAELVSAINQVQQQLSTGVKINGLESIASTLRQIESGNASNISELQNAITQNQDTNNQALLDALSSLQEEVASLNETDDVAVTPDSGSEPCEGDDCTQVDEILTDIKDIQEDIKCQLTGDGDCIGEDNREPAKTASDFYTTFASTQWGSTLTQISTSANGVSGSCNLDFSLYVPYAETDITAPICDYINPISGTLRMFAIALWGLLGIRHIFSA